MTLTSSSTESQEARLKALSRFAHALRTPINHIVGYSELLTEEIEDKLHDPQFLPDLSRIAAAGRDLLTQVNLVIEAARASPSDFDHMSTLLREQTRMALDQIMGYSEILIKEAEGQDALYATLTKINAAGKRIITLIDEGVVPPEPSAKTRETRPTPETFRAGQDEEFSDRGYILVVDDSEINRDILSRRLRREGYAVVLAENARQALDLINVNKFDLVILDILMPEIDGLEMLQIIRQSRSITQVPIIMATAKDQTADIVEALRCGANDYVTKPIDMPILLARIDTQLRVKRLAQLKDEFLRIASHDLKNPLSTILMAADLLRLKVPVGTPITADDFQMFEFIVRRGEEMQRLIRDFLDFQATQDGALRLELRQVDLNAIATTVLENNANYAREKTIELFSDLDEGLRSIRADAARLLQVAQNYLGNAIKFSSGGSQTTIRTRHDDDTVYFEVIDGGPGLKPDDLKRAFAKYAQLSNRPTGGEHSSGLGLAICRQMIELHGGQVGVYNNPSGIGATFWFSLPLASEALSSQ
jgi:two-component system, sensor histidine kinase and response regulator